MAESFFNVEDFIQSILSQLDKVQDALRMKSVNRPLTYALKDFSLDFQVFGDVDQTGVVRFRPASANEAGSSTLRLGFTTITKPMIEENTVSMSASRSPTLEEVGLAPDEARRLEGLGVRTTAQLDKLQRAAGSSTVARLAGVPTARLSDALRRGLPAIHGVQVGTQKVPAPEIHVAPPPPAPPSPIGGGNLRPSAVGLPRQVKIGGSNFPDILRAKFEAQPIDIARASEDEIVLHVPETAPNRGTLELTFGEDDVRRLQLEFHDPTQAHSGVDLWGGGPS
jgi:hypothetical protein